MNKSCLTSNAMDRWWNLQEVCGIYYLYMWHHVGGRVVRLHMYWRVREVRLLFFVVFL